MKEFVCGKFSLFSLYLFVSPNDWTFAPCIRLLFNTQDTGGTLQSFGPEEVYLFD